MCLLLRPCHIFTDRRHLINFNRFFFHLVGVVFLVVEHVQLVELKNGETYNGHLVSCDTWMNINLREVICTSRVS